MPTYPIKDLYDPIVFQFQRIVEIPEDFRDKKFDNFEVNQNNKEAFEAASIFVDDFFKKEGKPSKGLYLFGPTGVGKTHLVCAILNSVIAKVCDYELSEYKGKKKVNISSEDKKDELISYHIKVIRTFNSIYDRDINEWRRYGPDHFKIRIFFKELYKLIDDQKTLFGTGDKQFKVLNDIIDVDLLVLDDIGSEQLRHSEWELSILFKLVSARNNAKKPTLFTSNYDLNNLGNRFLKKSDSKEIERLLSRIAGNNDGIEIFGEDYRILKA